MATLAPVKTKPGQRAKAFALPVLLLVVFSLNLFFASRVDPQASTDAAYYKVIADQVRAGKGFSEPFVWQYLTIGPASGTPSSLDRPIDYWQPLGILIIALEEWFGGSWGPVIFSHILWTLLAGALFLEILRRGGNETAAFLGVMLMALGGKFSYYISTTDNIVFMAWFGFLFFRLIDAKQSRKKAIGLGINVGLLALTRVEGLLFVLPATWIVWKESSTKRLVLMLTCLFLVISPWVVRNLCSLGRPWPGTSRALYMLAYNDMFIPNLPLTWQTWTSNGWAPILQIKESAFWRCLLEFLLAPTFVLLPLWGRGLHKLWDHGAKPFLSTLGLVFAISAGVFSLQSMRGTAFHAAAAFFPMHLILIAIGFSSLNRLSLKRARVLLIICVIWAGCITFQSSAISHEKFSRENTPYATMPFTRNLASGTRILSYLPVQVYHLSGFAGVMAAPARSDLWAAQADSFGCRYLLLDKTFDQTLKTVQPGWDLIASHGPLLWWERRKTTQ